MQVSGKRIVLSTGLRTPIGQVNKSLAELLPEELMKILLKELMARTNINPKLIDGIVVGWVGQGSHAPNIARVASLLAGLPYEIPAYTVQSNCVSGIEAVSSVTRQILLGEGELFIAGGTESMSNMPYSIRGARKNKDLKTLDKVLSNWNELPKDPNVQITDCMEEGITDPVKKMTMAATAEICAQIYKIDRTLQDQYARESYARTINAIREGRYNEYVVPVQKDGETVLEQDENPFLREQFMKHPDKISNAPLLFDNEAMSIKEFYEKYKDELHGVTYKEGQTNATVSPFNACPRSDGAAVIIVTTEQKAKELNLPILAELKGWALYGVNPAQMGIAPAYSTGKLLKDLNLNFKDLDLIELHEAFAATCLTIFKLGEKDFQHQWRKNWEEGKVNRNGGTLALGHPLAATGTRIILNLAYEMKRDPNIKLGMAAACAAGGIGGSIVLKRYP
mgnify:CR=1 FL=1